MSWPLLSESERLASCSPGILSRCKTRSLGCRATTRPARTPQSCFQERGQDQFQEKLLNMFADSTCPVQDHQGEAGVTVVTSIEDEARSATNVTFMTLGFFFNVPAGIKRMSQKACSEIILYPFQMSYDYFSSQAAGLRAASRSAGV